MGRIKDFLVGRISWWEGVPGGKDFLVGRSSRQERFPGGKGILMGRISWWEGFSCGKEFPVGRLSWRERFLDDKDFPVRMISRRERFPSGKNSRGEGLQGGKDFLAESSPSGAVGEFSRWEGGEKFGPLRLSPFIILLSPVSEIY